MTPVERNELQAIRHDLTEAINTIHADLKGDITELRTQVITLQTSLAGCQARSHAMEECRKPEQEQGRRYSFWIVTVIGTAIITLIFNHVFGG